MEFGLIHENLGHTLRVELSSDLQCRVPVLLVLIHVNGLLGFVCLYEFFFCLLKTIFIFEMESEFQVNLRKLIFSMAVGECECLIELLLVGFEINGSLN